MTIPFNALSGGSLGAMWAAFHRQGLWAPGAGFVTAEDVDNGDTQIVVNALPNDGIGGITTNLWEPIRSPLPGTPGAGFGKALRLDPASEDVQVQIRSVDPFLTVGGDIVIQLEEPVSGLSGTLSAGAQIGPPHSPVLSVSSLPRTVGLVGVSHGFDDRGNAMTTSPGIVLRMLASDNQEGPFFDIGGVASPSFVDATGEDDVLNMVELNLPPMNFIKFIATPDGSDTGDTVFSLYISKVAR